MISTTCSALFFFFIFLASLSLPIRVATLNLTLPHHQPNPENVVRELQRRVNASISRRQMAVAAGNADSEDQRSCLTGNPIDDCWRCDPNWATNRHRLADCAVGFGAAALGGKGGQIYVVTDSSDADPANPTPGTLRHAVIQTEPLWIVFSGSMLIKLRHELIVNSYKTIDGRGANVRVTGGGCITLQYVSNVIIHNIAISRCVPTGNTNVRSSPTHVGWRGKSDGDGISISGSRNLWIDHVSLADCTDGLIDVIMGSTGITISNNYFSHHDKVMLLGHDDHYLPDSEMQVTIAFNHFGEGLVQRMPRCRRGYVNIVNNDFTEWRMYAIGGSANPTINSQGNRYTAPVDPDSKEVTKRVDTDEGEWADWNWRTEGDIMVNGAFFVPSGEGLSTQYAKASSVDPKSVDLIDQLTMNAGVLGDDTRDNSGGISYPEFGRGGTSTNNGRNAGSGSSTRDYFGMVFSGAAPSPPPPSSTTASFMSLFVILLLYILPPTIVLWGSTTMYILYFGAYHVLK